MTTLLRITGAGAPVYLDEALAGYRRDWRVSEDVAFQAMVLSAVDVREMVVWAITTHRPVFVLFVLRDIDGKRLGPARRWQR